MSIILYVIQSLLVIPLILYLIFKKVKKHKRNKTKIKKTNFLLLI
jgi:hypothetical protein